MTIKVDYGVGYLGSGTEPFADKGQTGIVMTERVNEIQEKYNCKLEWVTEDRHFWQKIETSILTGKPAIDLSQSGYWTLVRGVEKGGLYAVLSDYDDILELDSEELWDQQLLDEFYTIDGMLFGVEAHKYG
ncbi:MAG TPA: hypothetical protein PLZ84_02095, partial [Clostridia bacterium]|nr:hypothetical protein [Clostridia bacterium]